MSGLFSLALIALATVASAAGPDSAFSVFHHLALSPAAQTYYTGFALTESDTGTYATSSQVTGRMFAATDAAPTPSVLTTAVSDMGTAFTDAASRSGNATLNLGAGTIGGMVFTPGLYTWGSDLNILASCTCAGGANDTWIFQVSGDLDVASAVQLLLAGGAAAGNIVWVVSGSTTFGSTSQWNGIILGKTAIHMGTGASINGRLLAQSGITLQSSTIQSNGLGAYQSNSSTVPSTQKRSIRFASSKI